MNSIDSVEQSGPVASETRRCKIDVVVMATSEIDDYALETLASWRSYCVQHGYTLTHYDQQVLPELHINWSKIELARQHLRTSDCDWMIVADADTWVCDRARRLEMFINDEAGTEAVFSSDTSTRFGVLMPLSIRGVWECRTWICPNAGFFAIRNSSAGQEFMDEWMELPFGRLSDIADQPPRDQLVLWRGLFGKWKSKIRIDKWNVLRVLDDFNWWQIKTIFGAPFIAHDKRLTLRLKRKQQKQ